MPASKRTWASFSPLFTRMSAEKPCSAMLKAFSNGLGSIGQRMATSVLSAKRSMLLSTIIEMVALSTAAGARRRAECNYA